MLRLHFAGHSFITLELLGDDGSLRDVDSAPLNNSKDILELVYSGGDKCCKVFFKDIFIRGNVLINKIEVFSW